jgi:hypothetical protein
MIIVVSLLVGSGYPAEDVIFSTLCQIPHPADFVISMLMQKAQNIHFQKRMLWEKSSGMSPPW